MPTTVFQRAVFDLDKKRYTQLADEKMSVVIPTNDGRLAVGTDDRAYRAIAEYDAPYADYYLIDTKNGDRKLLSERQWWASLSWSPNGKYFVFYDGKDWNSVSTGDGKVVNLTKNLGVNFFNEESDTPGRASPSGITVWRSSARRVAFLVEEIHA